MKATKRSSLVIELNKAPPSSPFIIGRYIAESCKLTVSQSASIFVGCPYSLDWTTGMDYWNGILE
jgi:hypothetical protein